jgi:hypothetical protein
MILSFIAALQLAATVPAIQIEATTTSESSGATQAPGSSSRSVMIISGKNFRMEELERTGPETPLNKAGTVMLMRGDERKMFSIDPSRKEYFELDLTKMQSQIAALLKSMPGMEMKFGDMKASVEDLGDGEPLLGHPTRHYKMSTTMTINSVMGTQSMSMTMGTSSDTWFAKDLETPDNTMAADTTMLTQFRELIPGLDAKKYRDEIAKLPRLVPLKSVSTTASQFGPVDMTIKVTQLTTRVEKKQVPASTFEVPAGYRQIDMPNLVGSLRQ